MALFRIRVTGTSNVPRYNVPCPVVVMENQDFITILKNSGFGVEILEEIDHSRTSDNSKPTQPKEEVVAPKEEVKPVKEVVTEAAPVEAEEETPFVSKRNKQRANKK